MFKAYIFDMDGTLLDSEILWIEAAEIYTQKRGMPVSRADAERIVCGRSWHDIYSDLAAHLGRKAQSLPKTEKAIGKIFDELVRRSDIRIHSSIELLKRLAKRAPVCIVSGSTREKVEEGIDFMGIRGLLAFYLGAEDYTPGKPHPACYLKAAEMLDADPAACLVFEDSAAGVRAAKAAGMRCVALARDGMPRQDLSPADWIVNDLADVPNLLPDLDRPSRTSAAGAAFS